MASAADVFIEQGFDSAKIDEICRRAGASKASLYQRFPSKDRLFSAVIEDRMRTLVDRMNLNVMPLDAPVPDTLAAFGEQLLDEILSGAQVELIRTISSVSSRFPELGRLFFELGAAKGNVALSRFFSGKIERGELAAGEQPDVMARQFVVLCLDGQLYRKLLGVAPRMTRKSKAAQVQRAVRLFVRCYAVSDDAPTH